MTSDLRFDERWFTCSPVTLARRLLGQRLVRVFDDGARAAGVIVEVEAYLGAEDRAAHTFGGRHTERNHSMYLGGGHGYVYFIYGMHHCLNVVAGPPGSGTAVLIRALAPEEGLDRMRRNRGPEPRSGPRRDRDLASGPAKLTRALAIDRSLDGCDLRTGSAVFLERRLQRTIPASSVVRGPRIGVEYAGEWAERPLRFFVRNSPHVSR